MSFNFRFVQHLSHRLIALDGGQLSAMVRPELIALVSVSAVTTVALTTGGSLCPTEDFHIRDRVTCGGRSTSCRRRLPTGGGRRPLFCFATCGPMIHNPSRQRRPSSTKAVSAVEASTPSVKAETTLVNGRKVVHIASQPTWVDLGNREGGWAEPAVTARATVSDLVAQYAKVTVDRAAELVRFGAVYIGEVVEDQNIWKKPRGKNKQRAAEAAVTPAAERKRAIKAAQQAPFKGTNFEHMKLRRLHDSEAFVFPPAGSYLRVHCEPRTFPAAQSTNWKERIVAVTEDYVVLDKPAGVPSVPTIDNTLESAIYQAGLAVAKQTDSSSDGDCSSSSDSSHTPLHAVSRLDVCTSGLIVFARHKNAAATLNEIFRDRKVFKRYLTLLTPGPPVGLGTISHCCRTKAFDGQRRPRIYANYDDELLGGSKWGGAWQEARCTVLLCAAATGAAAAAEVARDRAEMKAAQETLAGTNAGAAATLEAELAASLASLSPGTSAGNAEEEKFPRGGDSVVSAGFDNGSESTAPGLQSDTGKTTARNDEEYPPHLCALQLETGRTHQLRLQLAAMGAGVVGDTRYRGVVGRIHRGVSADDRTDNFGQEPEKIALQAARLEFEWRDSRVVYSAPRPVWALQE